MGRAFTSSELQREAWERLKAGASALVRANRKSEDCYVGIYEWPTMPFILFRLERRASKRRAAVAVYVLPDRNDENGEPAFRVRALIIVNGNVSAGPNLTVPVSYNAAWIASA